MPLARTLAGGLIAALLCAVPVAGSGSPAFSERLEQADKIRSSDPKRFIQLLEHLDATKQQADPMQLQQLRYLHAYERLVYGNQLDVAIKQAEALFTEALDIDLKFRAGSLVANSHGVRGSFGEGLRFLEKTLPLRHQVRDKDLRHDGTNVAAILYNELGQYKLGRFYAEETLSNSPNPRARCFAGYLRLAAMHGLEALPPDDAPIQAVIDQCLAQGEAIVANSVRNTLARKWAAQGRRDKAIALLQRYSGEVKATRFPRLIGEANSLLAEFLLANGDLAEAELHAKETIENSAHLITSLSLVMAHKTMYGVARRRQDPAAALENYRRYAEADKNYLSGVKARELAYHIVRHETQQKTQQIELLNQQNQVLRLQQRVDRQATQNVWLLVSLLTLLVGLVGYWAYKVKRMHLSLRRFAETDALTGISNRHHFTQQAERSLALCAKAGEPVALIMFDLDHFKAINDGYGHVTGDWVLQHVAETCTAFCRRIDHLGRIGGEEFAILLHGCDLPAATRLAEDCRVRLNRIDTRDSGHAFAITASFGVSATSLSGYGLPDLMSHADRMLYRAKREGRNRVRAFVPDVPIASQLQAAPIQAA